jgi:hypothetical protein
MTKTWGPCTWFLFHTLAEKIKEDQFDNNKEVLLNLIVRICDNLPCPDCAGHARKQMANLNNNTIKTKQDLKNMLHSFHNIVNQRLNKPTFTVEELNNKYKLSITSNVIQYFIQIWSKRSHNPKLMTEDLHKSRVVNEFVNWWKINYHLFNP